MVHGASDCMEEADVVLWDAADFGRVKLSLSPKAGEADGEVRSDYSGKVRSVG